MADAAILITLVALPAAGALVLACWPGIDRAVATWVAMAVAVVELGLALALGVRYVPSGAVNQFTAVQPLAPSIGLVWRSGVDGISMLLVVLTALIVPIAILGAPVQRRTRSALGWLLLLEAATVGAFVSLDVLLFFIFFELTLVPAYFLIAGWGERERGPAAAMKFFVYTLTGSAFLFVGILYLGFEHRAQAGGPLTFSTAALSTTHLSGTAGVLLLLAFTAAFVVKAPVFPFHTWSPDAYAEAPVAGSVVLAALLAKLGTYGILRFDITLFGHAAQTFAPWLLGLAIASILYGALAACGSTDLKRLLAYSSLAQIGFIVLGTLSLNQAGASGAVLQMFNHGIIITALFLLVGFLTARTRLRETTALRGVQGVAPVLAAAFTVAMLASIGLPGLNGFVGEFLTLLGFFQVHGWWALLPTFGVVVAAIYLLWAYQQVFHGTPSGPTASISDLDARERGVLAPLVGIMVLLGVYPKLVLDRIQPSVVHLLAHLHAAAIPVVPR